MVWVSKWGLSGDRVISGLTTLALMLLNSVQATKKGQDARLKMHTILAEKVVFFTDKGFF